MTNEVTSESFTPWQDMAFEVIAQLKVRRSMGLMSDLPVQVNELVVDINGIWDQPPDAQVNWLADRIRNTAMKAQ